MELEFHAFILFYFLKFDHPVPIAVCREPYSGVLKPYSGVLNGTQAS